MKVRRFLLIVSAVFLAISITIAIFTLTALYFLSKPVEISPNSVLTLTIEDEPSEEPSRSGLWNVFKAPKPVLLDIINAIKKAGENDNIEAIYIRLKNTTTGFAKIEDIRRALQEFQKKGKKVVFFSQTPGLKEIYLSSVSPNSYISPQDIVDVRGIGVEVSFIKGTLEKLGIEPELERVGDYKSAVEPLTRETMSEEYREMLTSILNDIYRTVLQDMSQSLGVSVSELKSAIENGPYTSQEAINKGLVKKVLYEDEAIKEAFGKEENELSKVTVSDIIYESPFSRKPPKKIAILYAEGSIIQGESSDSPFIGKLVGSNTLVRSLREIRERDDILALVLRIDSPGGSGIASDYIWRELRITKEKIPIVVSMSDVAASGGYYIASPGSYIVVEPLTITGSIGVFAGKFTFEGLYRKIGVNVERVKFGKYADFFSPSRRFTKEERKKLHSLIEDFYNGFVARVAEDRKKSPEEIDRIARGRVWTGNQAVEIGLVDTLGGLWSAIEKAKELAGISPEEKIGFVIYPKRKKIIEDILENLFASRSKEEEIIGSLMDFEFKEIVAFKDERVLFLLPIRLNFR